MIFEGDTALYLAALWQEGKLHTEVIKKIIAVGLVFW